jgi:hypothetical protein
VSGTGKPSPIIIDQSSIRRKSHMKSFEKFPEAVRDASIRFTSNGDSTYRCTDGFSFSVVLVRGNSVRLAIELDLSVWEVPPEGKTMAVKFHMPSSVQVSEAIHRMRKSVRRNSEGKVVGVTLYTFVTPGLKTVELFSLSELWYTRSDSVRARRKITRAHRREHRYALA